MLEVIPIVDGGGGEGIVVLKTKFLVVDLPTVGLIVISLGRVVVSGFN